MPLIKLETIDEESAWGLWQITETSADLFSMLKPSGEDLKKINIIRLDSKKSESMACRLTAIEIFSVWGKEYNGVGSDLNGKPCLINSPFHISFSHSTKYAGAIVSKQTHIAIDIEMIRPKLLAVGPRILNQDELKEANGDLTKLCIYWCCKEVIYKSYSNRKISFREEIFIHPFSLKNNGQCTGELKLSGSNLSFTINYFVYDNYIIAFNQ
jgi:4'-phosphopantetheinyl transferase EntD